MPELPEVEIAARLISSACAGAEIESVLAPGLNAVKSFDPPLSALVGARIEGVRRRGKLFLLDLSPAGEDASLTAVIHLMSAGRLQLFDKRASLKDKSSRVLMRLPPASPDGPERELRLREFGTKQRAWFKLLRSADVASEETIAKLGPEAWPDTPGGEQLQQILNQARPLYTLLRDQHLIAGIGRSWCDEILHTAKLSPFKRGNDLTAEEAATLSAAIHDRLQGVLDHYEQVLSLPIPDKFPLPLTVHRHNGEPCPVCGTTIEAVFYEDYVMCYCPFCQTEGKVLKDRRLSRLLK
jgi:formamidopyrimidine-DNA glycosylase